METKNDFVQTLILTNLYLWVMYLKMGEIRESLIPYLQTPYLARFKSKIYNIRGKKSYQMTRYYLIFIVITCVVNLWRGYLSYRSIWYMVLQFSYQSVWSSRLLTFCICFITLKVSYLITLVKSSTTVHMKVETL